MTPPRDLPRLLRGSRGRCGHPRRAALPMDLEYELYAFTLFHRSAINRACTRSGFRWPWRPSTRCCCSPWLAVGAVVLLLG